MDNYNKLFMIIRKTDLLNYDEKNESQLYLMNLKEQVKKQKEVIVKVMNLIKIYGKYDGEKCTQGFQMWSADFNKILDILKEVSE